MSDSMQPCRRQPTRLLCPWDSPGKNTGVGCHFLLQCMKFKSESEVAQSCPTLSNPTDCSLPGSSIHGIFQARVLEWVPLPSPNLDDYITIFALVDRSSYSFPCILFSTFISLLLFLAFFFECPSFLSFKSNLLFSFFLFVKFSFNWRII